MVTLITLIPRQGICIPYQTRNTLTSGQHPRHLSVPRASPESGKEKVPNIISSAIHLGNGTKTVSKVPSGSKIPQKSMGNEKLNYCNQLKEVVHASNLPPKYNCTTLASMSIRDRILDKELKRLDPSLVSSRP